MHELTERIVKRLVQEYIAVADDECPPKQCKADWKRALALDHAIELLTGQEGDVFLSRDGSGNIVVVIPASFKCQSCGREEIECSVAPCADVVADREDTLFEQARERERMSPQFNASKVKA